jgi:hypothetical protein
VYGLPVYPGAHTQAFVLLAVEGTVIVNMEHQTHVYVIQDILVIHTQDVRIHNERPVKI